MRTISEPSPNRRVVIIGGGFAGTRTAVELERRLPADWAIDVLSQDNFITYNPLLPEVVGASLLPSHVVAPMRQMLKRARVSMVQVTDIDLRNKRIHYLGEGSGEIPFDHLVLAVGQTANLDLVPGMAAYALPLKTLGDALFLRNRIIARLEQAELQQNDEARRWLTRFVVIGGGFSGVETAGEILDFIRASLRYYPRIHMNDVMVHLIHSGDHLLPELSQSLGEFAARKMAVDGLAIHLNARATRIDDRGVTLDSGDTLSAGTIVCTIGTATNPLTAALSLPKIKGRIQTASDLSVTGHPQIWAVGDCAAVPNADTQTLSPPTAQFADRQARVLAYNIAATITQRPTKPFGYKPIGQLSTIGHNRAVAELFGVKLSGFIAWLLWRGTYLLKIPTLGRKSRLFLEWNWGMLFPPDIAHLGFTRSKRPTRTTNTELTRERLAS